MRNTRQMIAAALLGSLAFGMPTRQRPWRPPGRGGERHHHHRVITTITGAAIAACARRRSMAPPPMVIERPVVYRPAPVYAYPSAPAITIGRRRWSSPALTRARRRLHGQPPATCVAA